MGDATGPVPVEVDIDYRFTLANERTFLAWIRTSLALLAASVAVVQFVPDVGTSAIRETFGIVLAVLAACSAAGASWRWAATQRAMRRGQQLRQGALPTTLSIVMTLLALAVTVVLLRALGR